MIREVVLESVDSTNTEAMRRIARGETGPLWIRAVHQTAGKGRDGRRWVSEAGNFYGSLILPIAAPRHAISQLSLVVGVAVYDAVREVAGPVQGLRLKWPNDLLTADGKLSGILPESTMLADGRLGVAIGIGINIVPPSTDVGRRTAALATGERALAPAALVAPLGHWLSRWISLWSGGDNFQVVKQAWLDRAGTPGEALSVNTGTGPLAGTYQGLDDDGALLMQLLDGAVRRVTFGDVMLASEG